MVLEYCKSALFGYPTVEYEEDIKILEKAIKIIERDCTKEVKDKILDKLCQVRELKQSFVTGFEKGCDYTKHDKEVKAK